MVPGVLTGTIAFPFFNQLCYTRLMTVLITGITGMIGLHVAKATHEQGLTTYGIARNSAASRTAAIQDPSIIRCDILDQSALDDVFNKVKPTLIVHMAAQAFNGASWQCESITQQTNYIGTANVLNCCRKITPDAKVLLACSSAEYGDIKPEDCPLKEDRLLKPISPYGVSKVATENLGYQYYSNYGLKVFLPRLFIHVGTGHPPATAIQNFARQLALISQGKLEPIVKVGNLETARDFIDVRDGVAAMMLLLEKGKPGNPINICTGEAWKIADILNMLIEISGLNVEVVYDKALGRPSDEPLLLGNNSKLTKLGWQRQYSMRQTLEAVYADWIKRA
jgi:GDP-4-dehydro-6-deoxy-D-mannose reductase